MNSDAREYEVRIWPSSEDRGFVAQVVDLPGISAIGDTREEAVREIEVALELALKTYAEDGIAPPAPRNPAAAFIGRLGGMVKSAIKITAARENGRKGGRPRKPKSAIFADEHCFANEDPARFGADEAISAPNTPAKPPRLKPEEDVRDLSPKPPQTTARGLKRKRSSKSD